MISNALLPLVVRLGLGVRDQLDVGSLRCLIHIGAVEDDGLDFKKGMYGSADGAKDELAKDLAAFANGRGGVIVVGVDETDGTASSLHPFDGADAAKRHVVSVHGSRVRPLVPGLVLEWVPNAVGASAGYLLIGVPRSSLAPHVAGDPNQPTLRFPVRVGSQTRYMSEAEVAARYAERMRVVTDSEARALEISASTLPRLHAEDPWVHVSLAPDVEGGMRLGSGTRDAIRDWVLDRPPTSVWDTPLFERPGIEIGHRRVSIGVFFDGQPESYGSFLELHLDGSAFAARYIRQDEGDPFRDPATGERAHLVSVQMITALVAQCLRTAAQHAVENAGAAGTASVAASIMPGSAPVITGRSRSVVPGTRALSSVPIVTGTVSLEAVVGDGVEWMLATKRLADEIVQCFGLDEVPVISAEGELRDNVWGDSQREVAAFAARYGIPIAAR